jgi:protoporphyrinogen oxidase
MSGKHTYSNKKINLFSRRSFLKKGIAVLMAIPLASFFLFKWIRSSKDKQIGGRMIGASSSVGHMLRGNLLDGPADSTPYDIVIVGGGVAGLSAARWLKKSGSRSICLLELEAQMGGNSSFGKNSVSEYPWGAHYLPIPNLDCLELIEFLKESGAITGFNEEGTPNYNDYHLCFDPEERLYISGYWQDGLIPNFGVPESGKKQIADFLRMMESFKTLKGKDGKYAYTIPIINCSSDDSFTSLDKISMHEYMLSKGFDSAHLLWYVDYCCRDDYGTNMKDTSAWAGIHYFASRKGKAANADASAVLTWPNGNGWLVERLREELTGEIQAGCLAYSVSIENGSVHIDYFEEKSGKKKRIVANKCILASPQFVNARILKTKDRNEEVFKPFTYAPWMVANITVNKLPQSKGAPISWDNVFYQSKSLGYVNANHQNIKRQDAKKVITYYYPLCEKDPKSARMEAIQRKHEDWVSIIINDLSKVHPDIKNEIENIDVWIWGHGMVRPVPGFIWGEERAKASLPVGDKIFFAHSDLSGISIFEEAFYQGLRAAKQALVKTDQG